MYIVAAFGLLMILLSAGMMNDPDGWSVAILKFSRMKYFHGFEILSRLMFGSVFIALSDQTLFPTVIGAFGYVMVAVGIGLLIAGPARHRQFAVWSAERFKNVFRPAGFVSTIFGVFIIYSALVGQ